MFLVITRPSLFSPHGYEITLSAEAPALLWGIAFAVPEKTALYWFHAVDRCFDVLLDGLVWGENGLRFRTEGVKTRLMAMLAADVEEAVAFQARSDAKIDEVLRASRERIAATRALDRAAHLAFAKRDGLI